MQIQPQQDQSRTAGSSLLIIISNTNRSEFAVGLGLRYDLCDCYCVADKIKYVFSTLNCGRRWDKNRTSPVGVGCQWTKTSGHSRNNTKHGERTSRRRCSSPIYLHGAFFEHRRRIAVFLRHLAMNPRR